MVDLSTGEVVGQMHMSFEEDCILGFWDIFCRPENYWPQIWRVQDGWDRVSYDFFEGCFHGSFLYKIYTHTTAQINYSWIIQLPYILDQLKVAAQEFPSFGQYRLHLPHSCFASQAVIAFQFLTKTYRDVVWCRASSDYPSIHCQLSAPNTSSWHHISCFSLSSSSQEILESWTAYSPNSARLLPILVI
ncbi:hypothetical protein GYMLUDRAFT_830600 [Collybiopsis luxurians FD-317 M1]|uniref:Uncharacterized protein n=1 Tax=Collybiopsis luxurians FD-317 M1 TaxID=944289 RepID=A0A0D0CLA5_9AGAR|nr:hypothetical protein GYMLUDRAFT_830600 [Collybiopsis luxurians FD-317 M1]